MWLDEGTRYQVSDDILVGEIILIWVHLISLGDDADPSNFLGFRGLVPLLPHLCPLSVLEVGVCGVYSESP